MMRPIWVLLLCASAASACPVLDIEHQLSASMLDVRLVGMEDDTQVLVELISEDEIIGRAVVSNESISFARPAPGDYLARASILYPSCEGQVLEEVSIGALSSVHYRSSTYRLWPLSIALLLAITTLLCIALILRR